MKKLAAIALAGVAAFAVLLYFGRPVETDVAPAIGPAQVQPPIQEVAAVPTPPPTPTLPTQPEPPTAPTPKPIARLQALTPTIPVDAKSTRRTAPPLTEKERQQLAACDAAWQRKTKAEEAARNAESKDPAWAYRMEEKLREYFARRFQSIPIEVTSIDCKTSVCDLRAQSFSPETTAEFTNAIHALTMQPPADFRGMSMSNTEEAGKTLYVVQLKRLQELSGNSERPTAEQEACWKITNRQAERERAARDAEPRDAGWADTTEQLLRQHITAALAKHPLDRLDIACRTTFCEIKAGGRTPESQLAFQKVSQEVGAEPWADLLNGEGGSSGYGDRWEATQMLYRQ